MRPRELFGAAVRVIGFWFLTQSAYWFYWAVMKTHTSLGNPNISASEDAAYGAVYLLLGVFILAAADPIVWIFYGLPPKTKPAEDKLQKLDADS